MKDYVFISWSKNRELAIEIKNILDKKNFIGVVGGDYEHNPENLRCRKGTVNETVNYQMMHCDQSILLFQKIDGGDMKISGNLIYELGYMSARYSFISSLTNLHVFKLDKDITNEVIFPSNLHGTWSGDISVEGKTDNEIANEIVDIFLGHQNQIKKRNKFETLSDHYFIEYEMQRHFKAPSMSDYDLAVDLLVYAQSAFCYKEQDDILQKVEQFKAEMHKNDCLSKELELATDYALIILNLFCLTGPKENGRALIDGKKFRDMLSDFEDVAEDLLEGSELDGTPLCEVDIGKDFNDGNFEAWLVSQMQEHVTYLILVYISNLDLDTEERRSCAESGRKYCEICIKNLEQLAKHEADRLYANILLSYAYKNASVFSKMLGEEQQSAQFHKESFCLRRKLNRYVNKGKTSAKPSLKDYINLEYLLQVVEELKSCGDSDRERYLIELEKYIEDKKASESSKNLILNFLINKYDELKD